MVENLGLYTFCTYFLIKKILSSHFFVGRLNFAIGNDFKGIINGDVFLNDAKLENWNMTSFPFDNITQIDQLISNVNQQPESTNAVNGLNSGHLWSGPIIFHGTFDIDQDEIVDTYINPTEWGKVG